MRRPLLFLLMSACATTPIRTTSTPATLPLPQLAGTWRVVATNFPMWTGGARKHPTFTYGLTGERTLSDLVAYEEDGTRGTAEGFDTQDPRTPSHFTWRGVGILSLFASEWDVVALDEAGAWAVIAFSATLATPEGVDVIFREPPSPEALQRALSLIASEPALATRARGLTVLPP